MRISDWSSDVCSSDLGMRDALVAASCAVDWCVDADHIIFGQTHSHASADLQGLWGGVPQDWIDNVLYAGAAQALQAAIEHRARADATIATGLRSEEHTSELQSLMRISYAVFCL